MWKECQMKRMNGKTNNILLSKNPRSDTIMDSKMINGKIPFITVTREHRNDTNVHTITSAQVWARNENILLHLFWPKWMYRLNKLFIIPNKIRFHSVYFFWIFRYVRSAFLWCLIHTVYSFKLCTVIAV